MYRDNLQGDGKQRLHFVTDSSRTARVNCFGTVAWLTSRSNGSKG